MTFVCFYGSSLDLDDLDRFAEARGFELPELEPVGPAWLPDRRLSFGYHSLSRGGGALDIVPAPGFAVQGYVFATRSEATLRLLDRKEGHPRFYRRVELRAYLESGVGIDVLTWEVCEHRRVAHVPPTQHYVDLVRYARERLGLEVAPLLAAAGGYALNPVAGVFAYGTLRTGHLRAHLLVGSRRLARLDWGCLADAGPYPVWMPTPPSGYDFGCPGELVTEIFDLGATVEELDLVEGPGFERVLVRVEGQLAWTYAWRGSMPGPPNEGWAAMYAPSEDVRVFHDLALQVLQEPVRRAPFDGLTLLGHEHVGWLLDALEDHGLDEDETNLCLEAVFLGRLRAPGLESNRDVLERILWRFAERLGRGGSGCSGLLEGC